MRSKNFNEHNSCVKHVSVKALNDRRMRRSGLKPLGAPYKINKDGNPKKRMNYARNVKNALKGRMMRQNGLEPFGAPYKHNNFGKSTKMKNSRPHRNDFSYVPIVDDFHCVPYV